MRVTVEFHRQVEDDLRQWLTADQPNNMSRQAFVPVFIDELKRILAETRGKAPGAVLNTSSDPRVYSWRYTGELQIVYEVRFEPGKFLRPGHLRIIITELLLESAE
jgi:hypothetical protein